MCSSDLCCVFVVVDLDVITFLIADFGEQPMCGWGMSFRLYLARTIVNSFEVGELNRGR